MLALTVSLGIWQLQRLHWKQGLLAEIDRAEAAPAVPMPGQPAPFEKVEVRGLLRTDLSARYGTEVRGTAQGAELGSHIVVPLDRPGEPPLLVDRGWAPDTAVPPIPNGPVTLTGYIRPPETGSPFAPNPDQAQRRFWSLDPATIGAALGLPSVAPYTLVLLGPLTANPIPAQSLPRPPNDHLGYAITWFGLSASLVIIFIVFARRTLRS